MNFTKLVKEFQEIAGADDVFYLEEDLMVYECDGLTVNKHRPLAVVNVSATDEVSRVVKRCNRERVPFVARGAGTGLSGGATPLKKSVIINFAKMNRVLEVDLANRYAVVEAGIINLWVTNAVSHRGFYFAPDPSSQPACTIGGNVAENSGGPHCLKYGVTTNHIMGLEVVLPNGEVAEFGGRLEDAPGFDLTGVMVGSEGTLGMITKAIVKLIPKPEAVSTLMAIFENIHDASNAVSHIIGRGILPAAIEMMDQLALQAVEADIHAGYPLDAGAVLLIELDGLRDGMDEQMRSVEEICRSNSVRRIQIAQNEEERMKLWAGRKRAFGAMGRISPSYYIQDGVIPRTRLPEILNKIYEIGQKYSIRIANVFHAGDGNLHPLLLFDERDEDQRERVFKASHEILKACVEAGGTLSGEHGIGMEKKEDMPLVFNEDDLEAMRKLREVFNPLDLANPGKIFPTPGRCAELSAHREERAGLERW